MLNSLNIVPLGLRQSPWLGPVLGFVIPVTGTLLVALFRLGQPRERKNGNTILLLGLPDSGKTAILNRLAYDKFDSTRPSLYRNQAIFNPRGASKYLVLSDIPGHPKLRAKFAESLHCSKGVVLVVDSSTITDDGPSVAEHLHSVLHSIAQLPSSIITPSIFILANKADLIPASPLSPREAVAAERVRTVLEHGLEKLRPISLTADGGLRGNISEANEGTSQEGQETASDMPFSFANWQFGEVTVAGGFVDAQKVETATGPGGVDGDGLAHLRLWLKDL